MTRLWLALLVIGAYAQVLPDHALTPGATDPHVTQATISTTICQPGYTAKIRYVTAATKRRVYRAYQRKAIVGVCCEVDHLIPLILGGSNVLANLWPQPYKPAPGAFEKDMLEHRLARAVCSGRMTLREAQAGIAGDWYLLYVTTRGLPASW